MTLGCLSIDKTASSLYNAPDFCAPQALDMWRFIFRKALAVMRRQQPVFVIKAVVWILVWQLVLSVALGLLGWGLFDPLVAKGLLVGGLINTVSSVVFALSAMTLRATSPRMQIRRMALGELLKLVAVAVLFYMAIVLLKVQVLPTMAGFMAATMVFWAALLRSLK